MPWNDNDGGWKGGGSRGPWGQGPSGGSGAPPDLEEILKKGQDRLKQMVPGGSLGGRGLMLLALVGAVLWIASGFYTVEPDEQGVVLRFGKFVELTQPGLNYHLPFPVETAQTPKVTKVNRVEIGMRGASDSGRGRSVATRDVPEESLMLTGDENIVDVDFTVFWVIKNAADYLFNVQNPPGTVKAVAESAMREVVGQSEIQPILTGEKLKTETSVQELMQKVLDGYGAGIEITQVQLQKVDPPGAVIDSFRDVQAARADQERLGNEAEAYANKVVPEARGSAARITQAAEAYRAGIVAQAVGQAARFELIYAEYVKAPDVTRQRMYFETMEKVFTGMDKIVIDQKGGQSVVPYLPLSELNKNTSQGAN
ncbi:MAG: FtsH protease activity modulator HflK [Alphaproteobacteria bacterium]